MAVRQTILGLMVPFLCTLLPAPAVASVKISTSIRTFKDCPECPQMVPVTIPWNGRDRPLIVARYELTWKEYLSAYDEAKCAVPRNINGKVIDLSKTDLRDDFPMTAIKPLDFDCYLAWIRRKTGKPYRLPTEAEWIAIARKASGRQSMKAKEIPADSAYLLGRLHNEWGHTNGDPRRSVDQKSIWRAGQFKPDKLGLYDLFGNAAEAVSDPATFLSYKKVNDARQVVPATIVKGGDISYGSSLAGEFDVINGSRKYLSSEVSSTVGFRVIYEGVK